MDWTEVGKTAAPALVGALSAILSAVFTNIYAERRHKRELNARQIEAKQRTLEAMVPARLAAYQKTFACLQDLKAGKRITAEVCDAIAFDLVWIEPQFAAKTIELLHDAIRDPGSGSCIVERASSLQEEVQSLVGASELNRLFVIMRVRAKKEG